MYIEEIKIENFKGIRDLHIENLSNINVFVGKNNSSKTAILEALIFFFSGEFFSNKLKVPPNIDHYDKDGALHGPQSISLRIRFPENMDEVAEKRGLSEDNRRILKEKYYGKSFWFTRTNPNAGNNQMEAFIKQFPMREKLEDEDPLALDNEIQFLITEFKSYFSGNESIRFSSSIDGFRFVDNIEEYYAATYGDLQVEIRSGMRKIFSILSNLFSGPKRYQVDDFIDRRNEFMPKDYSKLFVGGEGDNAQVEFGERENTKSIPFYNQGDGEIDNQEFMWMFDNLSFPTNENTCKIYLIDEPENHKHPSLQRELLGRFFEYADDRQFFISTHSPIFTSEYKNSSVFLILRNKDTDSNESKLISDSFSGKEIKTELGLLNTDYFFSNGILFIEGRTEAEIVPSIFEFFNTTPSALGLEVRDVGGIGKVTINMLREALAIISDTDIVPFICLDNDPNAKEHKNKIIKGFRKLFSKTHQYKIWESKFIESLPQRMVLSAYNQILKKEKRAKKYKIDISKKISPKDLENYLLGKYNKDFGDGLSKVVLGEYIAKEISGADESLREELEKSEVFIEINLIIEHLKAQV